MNQPRLDSHRHECQSVRVNTSLHVIHYPIAAAHSNTKYTIYSIFGNTGSVYKYELPSNTNSFCVLLFSFDVNNYVIIMAHIT